MSSQEPEYESSAATSEEQCESDGASWSSEADVPQEELDRESIQDLVNSACSVKKWTLVEQSLEKLVEDWIKATDASERLQLFMAIKSLFAAAADKEVPEEFKPLRKRLKKSGVTKSQLEVSLKELVRSAASACRGSKLYWFQRERIFVLASGCGDILAEHLDLAPIVLNSLLEDIKKRAQECKTFSSCTTKKTSELPKIIGKRKNADAKFYSWRTIFALQVVLRSFRSASQVPIKASSAKRVKGSSGEFNGESEIEKDKFLQSVAPKLYSVGHMCVKMALGHDSRLPFALQLMRRLVEAQQLADRLFPMGALFGLACERLGCLMHSSKYKATKADAHDNSISAGDQLRQQGHVLISLNEGYRKNAYILDTLWTHYTVSITAYLSSLAHHPSYPEVTKPILNYLVDSVSQGCPGPVKKFINQLDVASKNTSRQVVSLRGELAKADMKVARLHVLSPPGKNPFPMTTLSRTLIDKEVKTLI